MKAVCWYGRHDVRTKKVPDPILINPRDAIVRVTAATICGSDLHIYDGCLPSMVKGDVIGHEFMGEVVETGEEVRSLRRGDRVVVSPVIACGQCWYCRQGEHSLCDNTNPNARLAEAVYNQPPAAIYGYSHLFGGVAGAFAEYVRVPFADVGAVKVPEELSEEQALFVSDALPTGWQAAELCGLEPGQVVAVWGCGAVGLMAMQSAYALGAGRVIAIDRVPYRLETAREKAGAEPLNFEENRVLEALEELTGGRGPDACIDAVGMEADGTDERPRGARGDPGLPQGRGGLADRRLCLPGGQDPAGRGDEQGAHPARGTGARPPPHAAPAGDGPGREDRSLLPGHPPLPPGSGAARLRGVPQEAGRLPAGLFRGGGGGVAPAAGSAPSEHPEVQVHRQGGPARSPRSASRAPARREPRAGSPRPG